MGIHRRADWSVIVEPLFTLLAFGALAVLLLPLVILLWHGAKLRRLEASVQKLAARLSTLESPGAQRATSAVPAEAARAYSPPVVAPPEISPIAAVAPAQGPAARVPAPVIDWEAFFGVKLFAWLGGFVLFLGVAFLVKYSFEHNLITPGMRCLIGGAIGLALLGTGWFATQRNYRVPGQSLCATGVLVLYADIFGAHAFYGLISLAVAFLLMSLVTVAAFLLAVQLDAQVIVVLGMLGGFVTPALLWTGMSKPLALFGYVAILNSGVAAVVVRKRWDALLLLAALGTVVTEFGWLGEFFNPETANISRVVFAFFGLQFLLICLARQRVEPAENWSALASAVVLMAGILAAFSFIWSGDARIHSAGFVFPLVFLCNVGVIVLAIARQSARGGWSRDWIVAIALALTWAVEWTWFDEHFAAATAFLPLLWYVVIFALFVAYPYFAGPTARWPWTIAAAAGAAQFSLVYRVCEAAYPFRAMGLVPLFFALPFGAGVWFLAKRRAVPLNSTDQRIASQAGAALLFLSLVIPVQLRAEWITVGWALEGVALLLLYRRMPNARLPLTAVIVLCAAFVRLAFNPAVLEYHPRTGVPLWNWYLYAYGITAICLVVAGRLLQSHIDGIWSRRSSMLLYTLGIITAFLLLNLEIADYFSVGPTLTFSFSGNFARDMSYSIGWALFAFVLLLIGMRRKAKAVRYAGLTLLIVTLLKLFFHDLGSLNQLYRIGALIGVAVILIVASFVYQRFLRPSVGESSA